MTKSQLRALIIDPDPNAGDEFAQELVRHGWHVERTGTLEHALEHLFKGAYDLISLELVLPDGTANEAWPFIRKLHPNTLGIVTTASQSLYRAVKPPSQGILAYLLKPIPSGMILLWENLIRDQQRLISETRTIEHRLASLSALTSGILSAKTQHAALQSVVAHMAGIFKADWVVLSVLGEENDWAETVSQAASVRENQSDAVSRKLFERVMAQVLAMEQQRLNHDTSPLIERRVWTSSHLNTVTSYIVPILSSDELLGVLIIANRTNVMQTLSVVDTQFLTLIQQLLANTLLRFKERELVGF